MVVAGDLAVVIPWGIQSRLAGRVNLALYLPLRASLRAPHRDHSGARNAPAEVYLAA